MSDLGFTHVALPVTNVENSIAFYAKYAGMEVVHRRIDHTTKSDVAWISDRTRPFVIVLIEAPQANHPLLPIAHLGVACASRDEVDRLCEQARSDNILKEGPHDYGYPVGYWAFITDPDHHTLEISYGQEIGLAVEKASQA